MDHSAFRPAQSGFSMLEVLIAIVVVSFGLLGLAGMQVLGLKNNHSANMRSTATQFAYDLSDRMRGNMKGVMDGNYHLPTATQSTACTGATGCSTLQLAQNDYWEWLQQLNNATNGQGLPAGTGVVCVDSTPTDGTGTYNVTTNVITVTPACDGLGSQYVIKIFWVDDRSKDPTDPAFLLKFTTGFQPQL